MLANKKSKTHRMRGTNSHGWGHKKKHRGKGHRGGIGLSGTGARGDAKKSALLTNSKSLKMVIAAQKGIKITNVKLGSSYFGKKGFTSIKKKKSNTLSISYIEENFDKMLEQGLITKEKEGFVFDSTAFKIDKILGRGSFTKKIKLIANEISASAKQKIEEVGGSVEVLNPSEDDGFDEE
ncbi:MAG: uL15 family ribosomal protein [Nanoarchaeota archaeon]|nr:uL15 family ribosomal protein [Nanoarchaeota archaeon]